MEALSSTHLFGRHLVLQYAKQEDQIHEIRAKTLHQLNQEQAATGIKRPRLPAGTVTVGGKTITLIQSEGGEEWGGGHKKPKIDVDSDRPFAANF